MNYNQLVANKIREARLEAKLSAEYVASQLSRSKSSYSAIENGKTMITVAHLEILCKVLNRPLNYFLPESSKFKEITNSEVDNIDIISNDYLQATNSEGIETLNILIAKLKEIIQSSSSLKILIGSNFYLLL